MDVALDQTDIKAEIYNTDRFAELDNASLDPQLESLGLAARFLVSFLISDCRLP